MSKPKLTTQEYIRKVQAVHGDRFDYSKVDYTGNRCIVYIGCRVKNHGFFEIPSRSHLQGAGCSICSGVKSNQYEFLEKAKAVHGNRYNYSEVVYKGCQTHVTILCKDHGPWPQTPITHLNGNGCPKCSAIYRGNVLRRSTVDFVASAVEVHGDQYDYSQVIYNGHSRKITIVCKKHGKFLRTPTAHLHGKGCSSCTGLQKSVNYSKVAIRWLEEYAKSRRLKNIQHAMNGGEYTILGTRLKVDGYHVRSNTVFEFHGSCFHGDPNLYKSRSKPHPFSSKTAGQLYKLTKEREQYIKSLGYNLVVVWENDYSNGHLVSYTL